MKENNLKMIIIILLIILAIAITGLMIAALLGNNRGFSYFNFNISKESKIILEKTYPDVNLTKVNIETSSSDIKVMRAETKEIKVVIYGEEQDNVKSELNGTELTISKFPKNHFCIGFCGWSNEEVIVYLPENQNGNLEIKTVSGKVGMQNFKELKAKIKTTSGDINLGELEDAVINTTSGDVEILSLKSAEINTVSGEIEIQNVNSEFHLKTTSGDIELGNFFCEETSNIKTISGEVTINRLNNAYVEAKSISGDIRIEDNERTAPFVLTIETTSGDIKVK